MTRFYIIRHGESEGNLKRICLGHTDLDLTDRGREQAARTAEELKNISFDHIYSSDLKRAVSTAMPHAQTRGLNIEKTADLRELYFGKWENRYVADLEAEYGEMFTIGWRLNFGTFVAPDGESVENMSRRAISFLKKVASEHPDSTILVTSHAALIRALWGVVLGFDFSDIALNVQFPSNASYSVLDFDGEKFIPVSYSNDTHLEELKTALPMSK